MQRINAVEGHCLEVRTEFDEAKANSVFSITQKICNSRVKLVTNKQLRVKTELLFNLLMPLLSCFHAIMLVNKL